ncbi:hypothetical protein E2C01_022876 [Portunus trituberculatus]|uniref:Uncharacterized protein n=1 Tax=Portunus trituberculatus TaxID=210409 RepID=A0A5B7E6J8_PORTR|nr:hypothetical protein [Portunus trituberculatus]
MQLRNDEKKLKTDGTPRWTSSGICELKEDVDGTDTVASAKVPRSSTSAQHTASDRGHHERSAL